MTQGAQPTGLQAGYSQKQWGPWRSHGLLLQESIQELGWQDRVQDLVKLFASFSKRKDGFLTREEFGRLLQDFPCCEEIYLDTFFELFDRNQDGLLNESDFVGGMLAVSPLAPHKIDTPCGQLRLQFIFLYYDANRNGVLETEEAARMVDHLHQLRNGREADFSAQEDAKKLTDMYDGCFGFAAFFDAASKRIVNGTSQLLRTQEDLCDMKRRKDAEKDKVRQAQEESPKRSRVPAPRAEASEDSPQWRREQERDRRPPATLESQYERLRCDRQRQASVLDPLVEEPLPARDWAVSFELRLVRKVMELSTQAVDWHQKARELVSPKDFLGICNHVVELFRAEDSLVEVKLPCRVYGDIHGQLPDLLQFFNAFSWPDKRRGDIFSMNYLFLGDFVDRGSFSVLVISILFSLKILYPKKVFMVRGNHEDRLMNVNYGFYQDCLDIFGAEGKTLWERANDVFEFLPLACLVEGQILCIHGGIGDSITSLDELRGIPKPIVVPAEINADTPHISRVVLDALWSDPTENDMCLGVQHSPRGQNTCRFGPDRVDEFNRKNGIRLIVRAHECVQAGYEYFAGGQLLTVFSATNYCNVYENDGALLVLVRDEDSGEIVEHAQVIKSGSVDTSQGWKRNQYRSPSPMRTREQPEARPVQDLRQMSFPVQQYGYGSVAFPRERAGRARGALDGIAWDGQPAWRR